MAVLASPFLWLLLLFIVIFLWPVEPLALSRTR